MASQLATEERRYAELDRQLLAARAHHRHVVALRRELVASSRRLRGQLQRTDPQRLPRLPPHAAFSAPPSPLELIVLSQQHLEQHRTNAQALALPESYTHLLPSLPDRPEPSRAQPPPADPVAVACTATAPAAPPPSAAALLSPTSDLPAFRSLLSQLLLSNIELRVKRNNYSEHILSLTEEKLKHFDQLFEEKGISASALVLAAPTLRADNPSAELKKSKR